MKDLTEHNVTEAVLSTLGAQTDPRLAELMGALVRHLHAFVRETRPTRAEWMAAIDFLTRTGQLCDDIRQEFVLLSDTLGVSILVETINQDRAAGASENSLFGPFFRPGAREVGFGGNIARTPGEAAWVEGHVRDTDGAPVAGALIEIWQTADNGQYEGQDPHQPESNLRARLRTEPDGCFAFRTIKPRPYPIPTDGPVGQMLAATGRHAMRPAHIHFVIEAPGFQRLVTALYSDGDAWLDSDAVLGVKGSLVIAFERNDREDEARRRGLPSPHWQVRHDFVLARA